MSVGSMRAITHLPRPIAVQLMRDPDAAVMLPLGTGTYLTAEILGEDATFVNHNCGLLEETTFVVKSYTRTFYVNYLRTPMRAAARTDHCYRRSASIDPSTSSSHHPKIPVIEFREFCLERGGNLRLTKRWASDLPVNLSEIPVNRPGSGIVQGQRAKPYLRHWGRRKLGIFARKCGCGAVSRYASTAESPGTARVPQPIR